MPMNHRKKTRFLFEGPSGVAREVEVCVKWDKEAPLVVVGKWALQEDIAEQARANKYVREWASIGVQMIKEERIHACDSPHSHEDLPESVRYYEILKTSQIGKEYPVSECDLKWQKLEDSLVARDWEVTDVSRDWKQELEEEIQKKITWILNRDIDTKESIRVVTR
jgi:hypothetical protein